MNKNRLSALLMSAMLAGSISITPAFALEYDFQAASPDQQFYQATQVGSDAAADSGTIVVGADGTIGTDESNLPKSSPLSVLDLPVGEYPNAWGITTDIAIANNTVFPNAYAPTTQWSNVTNWVAYDNLTVSSGALPTGAEELTNAAAGYMNATAVNPMPAITQGGAIGQVSIGRVGLSCYVYEGTSQNNMLKGAAHFDCTSGWDGNIALAGHNRGNGCAYFANLKDVVIGDIVTYSTAFGTRTYQVTNVTTCATTDTSGLMQNGENKITFYTCKENLPSVKLCVVATLVA